MNPNRHWMVSIQHSGCPGDFRVTSDKRGDTQLMVHFDDFSCNFSASQASAISRLVRLIINLATHAPPIDLAVARAAFQQTQSDTANALIRLYWIDDDDNLNTVRRIKNRFAYSLGMPQHICSICVPSRVWLSSLWLGIYIRRDQTLALGVLDTRLGPFNGSNRFHGEGLLQMLNQLQAASSCAASTVDHAS